MTYCRVIPRDLFNEANLLKCLGRLAILLGDRRDHVAALDEGYGDRFMIEQSEMDGSIDVANLPFNINGREHRLYRPLNSRQPWPLWLQIGDEDIGVFDDQGNLTDQFVAAIKEEN